MSSSWKLVCFMIAHLRFLMWPRKPEIKETKMAMWDEPCFEFHEKKRNLLKTTFSQRMHSAPITNSIEG